MDYRLMTAPCGLDCFNCPMLKAMTDEKLRKAIAENMNVPEEKAQCPGCRKEKGIMGFLGMSEPCGVYRCNEEKGLHNCSECTDFPCDRLNPIADMAGLVPHNTKVFNLALIKKMGLEKWATEKAAQVKKTYFSKKFGL